VLVSQVLDALELDDNEVLDENVSAILADHMALVLHDKRSLRSGSDPPELEFPEQATFVDFFEKTGAQNPFCQQIQICVHPRLISFVLVWAAMSQRTPL
jgi:hypothetical protein